MNQASSVQIISKDQSPSHKHSTSCAGCTLKGSCFPVDMEASNVTAFDAIVQRTRPLQKGEHVYHEGQSFTTMYTVRSGAFKAYSISADGEEQVTQFYLPGEIFGMDGLSRNRYATSVVALETSTVCAIPFERLHELSARIPNLQRHFFQLMSQVIIREQELILQLSKYSAERRVATFLQRISRHQMSRKYSASKIRLSMTRTDISCYLGLTVETVSRIFSRFQKIGLLTADHREIEILSLDWLHELANGALPGQATTMLNHSFDEEATATRATGAVYRRAQPMANGGAAVRLM